MEDADLTRDFVAESLEHLSQAETDLLALEKDGSPPPPEVVNRIFRALHSIKGAAGTLGFERIQELSHAMEGLLTLLRGQELSFDPEMVDALLGGVDSLRVLLGEVGGAAETDVSGQIARIAALIPSQGEDPPTVQPVPCDDPGLFTLSEDAYREQCRFGARCYAIRVPRTRAKSKRELSRVLDLVQGVGDVLDEKKSPSDKGKAGVYWVLVTSILEPDMLAEAVQVPADAVSEYLPAGLSRPEPPIQAVDPARGDETARPAHRAQAGPGEAPTDTKADAGRSGAAASAKHDSIRVRVALLDRLQNLVGELVLCRNQLVHRMSTVDAAWARTLPRELDRLTSELREYIMYTRMQPIGNLLSKFPRLVRDLAKETGKDVDLRIEGSDVGLDRSAIEALSDPLTHIVRNCMDHGIELPSERERAGKPRRGQIQLSASHEAGQVCVVVEDDGRGMDPHLLRRQAVEKGLIRREAAEQLDDREAVSLIFLPGFSTSKVTAVSGRGVGMDVVKSRIERFGGRVEIASSPDMGTTVRLQLPLTLAIVSSLVVSVEDYRFAIPQTSVMEVARIWAGQVARRVGRAGDVPVLRLRGRLVPLLRLADVLGIRRTFRHPKTGEIREDRRQRIADRRLPDINVEPEQDRRDLTKPDRRQDLQSDLNVAVVKADGSSFGLIVGAVHDIEEIVVRPLSSYLKDCTCFGGATIMGDGRVAMILDPSGLAQLAGLEFTKISAEEAKQSDAEMAAVEDDAESLSLILFANATSEFFALPLQSVSRVVHIRLSDIEHVGDREFVNLRGDVLPVFRLERALPVRAFPDGQEDGYVLVSAGTDAQSRVGVMASDVVDVLDATVKLKKPVTDHPGLVGSAIIRDHLTTMLEMTGLLGMADEVGKTLS